MGFNNKGYRGNIAGWGEGLTLFSMWFVSSFFYALLALGIRATQGSSSIPDLAVGPAIATAVAFIVATYMNMNATGGFVYHMHAVATIIIGTISRWFLDNEKIHKDKMTRRQRFYAAADREWIKLEWSRLLIASLAMLLGFFIAPAVIYLFAGSNIEYIPHSPGPFPGPGVFTGWEAFAIEAIGTAALGWVLTYFALTGYDTTQPEHHKNKGYKKGIRIAAYLLAGVVFVAFNYSGGCFDLALWVSEHVMVGWILGNTLFDGTADFWYAYVFGNMVGWVIGVSLGYISRGLDVVTYPDEEIPKDERDAAELMDRRIGNRSGNNYDTIADRQRQPNKRTVADVDKIAIASGLFGGESD